MTVDIRGLLQTALDTSLYSEGIFSYWNRKTESDGEDPDEYVVYTFSGDSPEINADDSPLLKVASATVQYYYRDMLLGTHQGRQKIKIHEDMIAIALISNGFSLPNGFFDGGDVDDIGYFTTIFECEYWRVV